MPSYFITKFKFTDVHKSLLRPSKPGLRTGKAKKRGATHLRDTQLFTSFLLATSGSKCSQRNPRNIEHWNPYSLTDSRQPRSFLVVGFYRFPLSLESNRLMRNWDDGVGLTMKCNGQRTSTFQTLVRREIKAHVGRYFVSVFAEANTVCIPRAEPIADTTRCDHSCGSHDQPPFTAF